MFVTYKNIILTSYLSGSAPPTVAADSTYLAKSLKMAEIMDAEMLAAQKGKIN